MKDETKKLIIDPSARDWEEDFDLENGGYGNTCCVCHAQFNGHKRRVVCKECANRNK